MVTLAPTIQHLDGFHYHKVTILKTCIHIRNKIKTRKIMQLNKLYLEMAHFLNKSCF